MTSEKRVYRKKLRAASEAATVRRITKSAVELHGTVGPSQTSMSAVAAHAGVRRSTLYRHFSDEAALFAACSADWLADNPLPDIAFWAAETDADTRLVIALRELYGYYRRNERMIANFLRDEETMAIVRELARSFHGYIDAVRDVLMQGRPRRARGLTLAAVGHAVAFSTWRSLAQEQGLGDTEVADLMSRFVSAAA